MKNIKFLVFIIVIFGTFISLNRSFSQSDGDTPNKSSKLIPLDSLSQNIISKINSENIRLDSVLKAESKKQEEKSKLLQYMVYAAGGLGLIGIILGFVFSSGYKKKFSGIYNRIEKMNSSNKSGELENRYNEAFKKVKNGFDETNSNVLKVDQKIENLKMDLDELRIKYDATSSFTSNVNVQSQKKEREVSKIISETESVPKSKFFTVEYFVDAGIVKFKETDFGTPFYIEQYPNKSELTINEEISASSNYSEPIQKCFKVNGQMTGKYRNRIPAKCEFDKGASTWKLMDKGEIESI